MADPIEVGPPVRLGGRPVGAPVRTGWDEVPAPPAIGQIYEHVQSEASTVWVVDHGLGHRPVAWSLYDDQGRERCEYVVEHPTVNRVIVRMDTPTAGRIGLI